MAYEVSIEVFDGPFAAQSWADSHGDSLIEAALFYGAKDWEWHSLRWGVVLELRFHNEAAWNLFRDDVAVKAALDAVPDPVSGLLVYRGRGGSAGDWTPRRPRPLAGSGANALPLPIEDEVFWSVVRPTALVG